MRSAAGDRAGRGLQIKAYVLASEHHEDALRLASVCPKWCFGLEILARSVKMFLEE
jgi:hypothetical protein